MRGRDAGATGECSRCAAGTPPASRPRTRPGRTHTTRSCARTRRGSRGVAAWNSGAGAGGKRLSRHRRSGLHCLWHLCGQPFARAIRLRKSGAAHFGTSCEAHGSGRTRGIDRYSGEFLGSFQLNTIHLVPQPLHRNGHNRIHDKRTSPRLARCERPTSVLPHEGQRSVETKYCSKGIRQTILQALITVQFKPDGGKFSGWRARPLSSAGVAEVGNSNPKRR